ncbi:N-acetyltransferase [uncultured Metabacillus sp.]|uniref:GNAT family N-acetyltransferase n=1 Tax=uncultured Metabacillus sp. TaxID=2860135 RepID=UPI002610FF40|nr:GNAT family N-acetyltransferase [uncultured Metabacillus sp.]
MKTETDESLINFIEQLAAKAWPCYTQETFENWTMRATFGVTKRANSVHTLGSLPQDSMWLKKIETFYQEKSIPPCFYISEISPKELDYLLKSNGYQKVDECYTMTASCEDIFMHIINKSLWKIEYLSEPDDTWIEEFIKLEGFSSNRQEAYAHIFSSIKPLKTFLRISDQEETIGLGTVVLEDGWACISNIVVNRQHRRKGTATYLMNVLTKWAYENGGHHMYLQVIQTNHPAIELYKKLGFTPLSKHHYRILLDD